MVIPTALIPKAGNTATVKPADARQQSVLGNKPSQSHKPADASQQSVPGNKSPQSHKPADASQQSVLGNKSSQSHKPADASQQSVPGNKSPQSHKPADARQPFVPGNKSPQSHNAAAPKANAQSLVSTSPAPSTSKSNLAAVLIPVKVEQQTRASSKQNVAPLDGPTLNVTPLKVTIDKQAYQVNKNVELQKLLPQTAQVVIASDQAKLIARAVPSVTLPQAQAAVINNQAITPALQATSSGSAVPQPSQTITTQLVLLAQSIQLALPPALEDLAKQNGVSTQQLTTLAARPQGYPLPTAVIAQGQLTFSGGASITLAPNTALNSGQYLAKVVVQQQQLQLTLTPVIAEVNVNLTKLAQAPQATSTDQASNIVITKNEPAQILSQFLKKLSSTPLPAPGNAVKGSDLQPKMPAAFAATLPGTLLGTSTAKSTLDNGAVKLPASTQPNTATAKSAQPLTVSTHPAAAAKLTQKNSLQPQVQNQHQAITSSANSAIANKSNTDPAPIEVLNKALSKAGAMPIKQALTQQVAHNLATELFKHLPQIRPHPLSALTDPALLSSELRSLAALNLAHTPLSHSPASSPSAVFSGSAITTLFQLLLGVKTKSAGSGISAKLQAHLAQLQQQTLSKLSANSGLLGALDKLGGADSLAQLASSVTLYQQASTDPNQAVTWYFALPYSINQRDEQFEGKFEPEQDQDEDKKGGWKLQLKFNLAQGSLLICAHKQADVLDIQFKGNNQMLLTKVEGFNSALTAKIAQIGFTPGKLTTQLAPIPATLLPGDHYLVKTRA